MRTAVAMALAALLSVAAAPATPDAASSHHHRLENSTQDAGEEFIVSAVSFGEEETGSGALAALACGALGSRGVGARAVPPPRACSAPAPPDARACLDAALAALARGALHAVLLPTPRAPAPPRLRDAGLEELGDAAPPSRRACLAAPPARSLLDFADVRLAARYYIPRAEVDAALRNVTLDAELRYICGNSSSELSSQECDEENPKRATLLTSDEGEAAIMHAIVVEHGLHARVAVTRASGGRVLAALAPRPALVCGRALRPGLERGAGGASTLGPPPCTSFDCPFEARRLVKLVNVREMARAPSAIRALARLALDEADLRTLEMKARKLGPEVAAREILAALPGWAGAAVEVRVAVMIPASTRREAYDAAALRAAAELAEDDEARAAAAMAAAGTRPSFEFKVELLDDACSGSRAFEYLTNALGSEFGSLSGVAGPACGGAFGDVTRQSFALSLPVLAYTAQAPPEPASAGLALLAAGDARRAADVWAELLRHMGWRRVAVLSETATRAALDPARLGADIVAHVELPTDGEALDVDLLDQWARRARGVDARILYVCVEDARYVRAALRVAPADRHNCSQAALDEAAAGHLSVAPAWAGAWERAPAAAWAARWAARPALADDLHRGDLVG